MRSFYFSFSWYRQEWSLTNEWYTLDPKQIQAYTTDTNARPPSFHSRSVSNTASLDAWLEAEFDGIEFNIDKPRKKKNNNNDNNNLHNTDKNNKNHLHQSINSSVTTSSSSHNNNNKNSRLKRLSLNIDHLLNKENKEDKEKDKDNKKQPQKANSAKEIASPRKDRDKDNKDRDKEKDNKEKEGKGRKKERQSSLSNIMMLMKGEKDGNGLKDQGPADQEDKVRFNPILSIS